VRRVGPVDWDERYASHEEGLWSGRVNGALVADVAELPPGRALDVGCGEGADAIWLARAGWQVTGVDISEVALERAAAGAREAGVTVEWVRADIAVSPPAPGAYDLVSVQYPALKHSPGDEAIRALLGAVAPGGTVLVVGHAPVDPDYAHAHGFEVADYVQPADVRAHLDEGWEVEVDETRPRVDPAPEGSRHTHDTVLRAKRHMR
jgi:SAM-dependent methyltransferase